MGCGASAEKKPEQQQQKQEQAPAQTTKAAPTATEKPKDYAPKDEETLAGKMKYLGDLGAVAMSNEEKRINIGLLLAFVDARDGATVFAYQVVKTQAIFAASLNDDAVKAAKDAQQITLPFAAVYKSIATELGKSKAKIVVSETDVTVEVAVTSVKDKSTVQKLTIQLLPTKMKPAAENFKYLIDPLARMVQKRRQCTEEKEKEVKVSRLQNLGTSTEAAVVSHRSTIDTLTPIIGPLREEAAACSKVSAELAGNISKTERRMRMLQTKKGKHILDCIYEDGGAAAFQHLPQAEEHDPKAENHDGSGLLEWIRAVFPLKETAPGAFAPLASITTRPTDPTIVQMLEKAPPGMAEKAMQVLTKMDDWDMNVFELEKATNNNALFHVAYAMIYKLNLVNDLQIDDALLRNFLAGVQSGYHPNPYHSATHAADVAQINFFIMTKGGLIEKCKLSKAEVLAGVIAGVIHDYDHPGFNNNFHTRTGAYLSTLYSDRSILENHHCACIFEMLKLPRCNFIGHLTEDQRREIRDTVIEMVLATDMGNHGKIFSSFRRRLGEGPEWHERKDDVRLALSMSIKMADISNCGRPKQLYLEWAKNIATEFYCQGDMEAKACLAISPFMDRRKDKQEFSKGQISFMNFIVVPMFEAISEFLPPVELSLKYCQENKEYWQSQD